MNIVVLDTESDGLAYECTKSDTAMVSEYKGPEEPQKKGMTDDF
jgi:hypothetical protein